MIGETFISYGIIFKNILPPIDCTEAKSHTRMHKMCIVVGWVCSQRTVKQLSVDRK